MDQTNYRRRKNSGGGGMTKDETEPKQIERTTAITPDLCPVCEGGRLFFSVSIYVEEKVECYICDLCGSVVVSPDQRKRNKERKEKENAA